jgi:hypothetical protein
VLLRLKPYAAEMPGLLDAVHAVLAEHLAEVLKQPEWLEFAQLYPKSAVAIRAQAEPARVVAEHASVNARLLAELERREAEW